ncbi:PBP superfamily domain-containing protein [Streptomyces sp. 3213]|uniref:substrate-binding domain-containing protein n=1 Tax=Streptomyces sp. 3213.3 TaxID=1855348 RepID=UPI00089D3B2E|nr:substrate-binding domain-containing protein [Streptomyces sp. 3213.3]SEE36925.1 PBP superfamily domain-containing protein [Streptomyces sp. 3213] [Streptomyces sp. 3213.3]
MNVKTRLRIGAGVGAVALGLGALAAPAYADPSSATDYRQLAGVGSDTTQDVVNALGDAITNSSGKVIASWNAVGSSTITTKSTGTCTIARPNGSGAGITALNAAIDGSTGCVDFARSSRGPNNTTTTDLTFIPYAKDAVSWVKQDGSALPDTLTTAQLKAIYECTLTTLNGVTLTPILPQSASGTRAFFLSSIGVTTPGSCVTSDSTIEENNGSIVNSAGDIFPYSVAQYTAQETFVVDDLRGDAVLGSVGGVAARNADNTLNLSFPYLRNVYNVVPTAKLSNALIADTFVGTASKVCANTATITNYGFGTLGSDCGSTTLKGES